jgi:hypothetical protein
VNVARDLARDLDLAHDLARDYDLAYCFALLEPTSIQHRRLRVDLLLEGDLYDNHHHLNYVAS